MGGVAAVWVGQPALRLVHPDDAVVDVPLRPATTDLAGVEDLERNALGGQAVGVVGHRDAGVAPARDRAHR